MAQRVQVLLVDDLDGSEATETIPFGLDGSTYEIDLNEKNAKAFHKAIKPYVEKGRKVNSTRRNRPVATRAPVAVPARSGPEPKVVRAWALKNGIDVNQIGRVPQSVVDQYEASHVAS